MNKIIFALGLVVMIILSTACTGELRDANGNVTRLEQAGPGQTRVTFPDGSTRTVDNQQALMALSAVGLSPAGMSNKGGQQAPPQQGAQPPQGQQPPAGSPGYRTPYGHTTQPSSIHAVRHHIGLNVWKGRQLDLTSLPDLGPDEWYVAYGDVLGNGSCAVKVFKSGKPSGLSAATWQLYKVTGPSDEARNDELAVQQEIAAREAGTCPMAP